MTRVGTWSRVGGGEAPGSWVLPQLGGAGQSGRARGAPKGRDGAVEAIRGLMVARRSARAERTQTNGQALALILSGPEDLPARFSPA
jgi:hypothetical protein